MGRLLLLFVCVPALELALLIEIGSRIGTLPTLALIAGTGVLGASLTRSQGWSLLRQIQQEMAAGRLPASSLLDAVMILISGALLLTPGILTDVVGFLGLVPAFRAVVKRRLRERLERAVREGRMTVTVSAQEHDPFVSRGPPRPTRPESDFEPQHRTIDEDVPRR
jgi:UPF0716 protein FxsA